MTLKHNFADTIMIFFEVSKHEKRASSIPMKNGVTIAIMYRKTRTLDTFTTALYELPISLGIVPKEM